MNRMGCKVTSATIPGAALWSAENIPAEPGLLVRSSSFADPIRASL
jgi:hypothetical protein